MLQCSGQGIRDGKDSAMITTYAAIQAKYGKKYCYPAQETVLRLMQEHQGVRMCRRTLNYRLSRLEKEGVIHRKKRHSKGPDGKMRFKTSITNLCNKVLKYVKKLANQLEKVVKAFHVQDLAQYLLLQRDIRKTTMDNSVKSVDNPAACVSAAEFFRCNPQFQRPSWL